MDHSLSAGSWQYPGLSPGSGEEPWITPEYKYALLPQHPFCQEVAPVAQGCHTLLGPVGGVGDRQHPPIIRYQEQPGERLAALLPLVLCRH